MDSFLNKNTKLRNINTWHITDNYNLFPLLLSPSSESDSNSMIDEFSLDWTCLLSHKLVINDSFVAGVPEHGMNLKKTFPSTISFDKL